MSYKEFFFNDFVKLNFYAYNHYIENSEVRLIIRDKNNIQLSNHQESFIFFKNNDFTKFLFSLKDFGDFKKNKFYFHTEYKASTIVKKFLNDEEYYSFVEKFNAIVNGIDGVDGIIDLCLKEKEYIEKISSEEEFEAFVDDLISSKTKVS